MSCLIKQIIINKLPLPDELIDIIKDYTFINIVDKTRETKKKLLTMLVIIRIPDKTKLIWIRKIHAYGNERAEFCLICGDYLWSYTCRVCKKIICSCDSPLT